MSGIAIWSAYRSEWVSRDDDQIIWLDRGLLSNGRDLSLHRRPRCPGMRFVHYRWEVFSRDPSHSIYLAPFTPEDNPDYRAVSIAAHHVLRPAHLGLETQPVRLDSGTWAISVGAWVLFARVDVRPAGFDNLTAPQDELPATANSDGTPGALGACAPTPTGATDRVALYFEHNPIAKLAIAYYYQDFIRDLLAPHAVPMSRVAIALDLVSDSAVSEYKKELQRRIWGERGHQRELGRFLISNRLVGLPDLLQALQVAAENHVSGRSRQAQQRLRYRIRKQGSSQSQVDGDIVRDEEDHEDDEH